MTDFRILTWNINSVRLRIESLGRLVREIKPDVVCLQETKVMDELFPAEAISQMGYSHQTINGMKAYNGVAILSKEPFTAVGKKDWCGKQDARHVFAELGNGVTVQNFYVPAGGDEPDTAKNVKFDHKLKFIRAATRWSKSGIKPAARQVLVGDLNIAPLETDVWSHKQLLKVVSHTPVEVDLLEKLIRSGPWTDAVREIIPPSEHLYSWWSYRSKDWSATDKGRRLDHIWVTEPLKDSITSARVLREVRSWDRPSDHAPVLVSLNL